MFRGLGSLAVLLLVVALASPTDARAVQNGNFEQGAISWVQSSTGGFDLIFNEPGSTHGGSWDAWLGGYNSGTDTLYQDFTVPANAATATLRFWYRITTSEVSGSPLDTLAVALVNPGTGATLASLAALSNVNVGPWTQSAAFDLSAYRGQTVRLRFVATLNATQSTSFRIDDVTLAVVAGSSRLTNISTRMYVLTGNDVMIGGFVIGGATAKNVAIVATGPSLGAFGIASPLPDPVITVVRSSDQAVVASNDDWPTHPNASLLQAAGFAPTNPLEAGIYTALPPGAYTAIVSGYLDVTGVAVIGVYEINNPQAPLTNISTRGRVLTGNDVMIGGFVVQGNVPQTLAIVATGPSLGAFGIANPLADPIITLVRSSDQAVIDSNDDWQAHPNFTLLQGAGFAPSNPLEAGMYVTLQPGAYTAIVSGFAGATGVGVIGVYRVN